MDECPMLGCSWMRPVAGSCPPMTAASSVRIPLQDHSQQPIPVCRLARREAEDGVQLEIVVEGAAGDLIPGAQAVALDQLPVTPGAPVVPYHAAVPVTVQSEPERLRRHAMLTQAIAGCPIGNRGQMRADPRGECARLRQGRAPADIEEAPAGLCPGQRQEAGTIPSRECRCPIGHDGETGLSMGAEPVRQLLERRAVVGNRPDELETRQGGHLEDRAEGGYPRIAELQPGQAAVCERRQVDMALRGHQLPKRGGDRREVDALAP